MIQPTSHLLRVTAVVDLDTVFVSDVFEGYDPCTALGANDRVVRSREMARAGENSFWLVEGEDSSPERQTDPTPLNFEPLLPARAVSFTNARAPARVLSLPPAYADKPKRHSSDVKSYKRERRLKLGFGLQSGRGSIDDLFGPGVAVPKSLEFHAVQIDAERWIGQGSYSAGGGVLKARADCNRSSVQILSLVGHSETLVLTSGVVLFVDEPRFTPLGKHDLRTAMEIAADTDRWLERLSQSVRSTELDRSRIADLRAVLQNYLNETVDPGEIAQLAAAMRILESRSELISLIPEIVRRDGVWSAMIQARIEQEAADRRAEIEASFEAERSRHAAELEELREQIASASAELQVLGLKRQAYEDAVKEIEAAVDRAVAARVAGLNETGLASKAELESLAARVDALRASSATSAAPQVPSAEEVGASMMNADDRKVHAAALAKASGIAMSGMAMLLSSPGTGRLPVLTGGAAGQAASYIVHGLSMTPPTIVFCDPTIVSLHDLLEAPGIDGETTMRSMLVRARARPDILFPIGLFSLTKSPCEYWLPALLSGQQGGQLPRNVLFVGSAEADGNRIGVPTSVLDRLLPLASDTSVGGPVSLAPFAWPSSTQQKAPPQEFVLGLVDLGLEGGQLRDVTKQAATLLGFFQCDVETFKAGVGGQMEWLGAVSNDGAKSHPQMRFFEASEA